jgi:RND family efflux transporter MFP subunit
MKRIALLSFSLAVAACGSEEPGRMPTTTGPVDVVVSVAERAPVFETFSARVVSERTAEIATRMSGTVDRVHVDVGGTVRAGDALVTLDAKDIGARVAAAEAGFALAERSFQRVNNLAARGAASAQELDQATAGLEAARSQLTEAKAQEAYAVVRAPFDGVVTHRSVDAGDLAGPGSPLLTMMAPGALKVVADLPAGRYGVVAVGDVVLVETPGAPQPIPATVSRTVPALDATSRTFRVEAHLTAPAGAALAGSYARLHIPRPDEASTWIPRDAVVVRGQLTGVMAMEDGTLRLRWVRIGQGRGDAVELLSGPGGDFSVVRRPASDLTDGAQVRGSTVEAWAAPTGVPSMGAPADAPEASAAAGTDR